MTSPERIRVVVIDDSAFCRRVITDVLSSDPGIEVVGAGRDPYAARELIRAHAPDVLTLDLEMPGMDGLTFLRILMRDRPMPVVVVSSLTERGAEATLSAMEAGAVDVVTKPKLDLARGLPALSSELVAKVRAAASARVRARGPRPAIERAAWRRPTIGRTTDRVIAIGGSTGGVEAIRVVLEGFPPDTPGVVVAQHMPAGFTRSWARRCDQVCAVRVKEAEDGDRLLEGHVLIAPGDHHLRLVRDGAHYRVTVTQDPLVNLHRPSVDVLFDSVARAAGPSAVGALLTGMGKDGARGLLAMRRAGASTIAQDEATSVVFGMPREAIALGGASEVRPLEAIAPGLLRLAASDVPAPSV